MEEKKEIKIKLRTAIILMIIGLAVLSLIGYITYKFLYDNKSIIDKAYKISYNLDGDEAGNGMLEEENSYKLITSYSEYKEYYNKIFKKYGNKIFNGEDVGNKFDNVFFVNNSLVLVEYFVNGSANLTTTLKDVCIDENVVNIYIDENSSGYIANTRGDIYFIPLKGKSINKVYVEYTSKTSHEDNPFMMEVYKPIIYLYPTKETKVSVSLGNPQNLSHTYPKYEGQWNVLAKPNGDLIDIKTGRSLYSLYWEGINTITPNMKEGFVIEGKNTIPFLEEKLALLGLTEREANEFIIYWLPKLENNQYNFIRFQTIEEINKNMPLTVTPNPDSTIRVMMEFKALDEYIQVPEQKIVTPKRKGFVLIEWGGTEVN